MKKPGDTNFFPETGAAKKPNRRAVGVRPTYGFYPFFDPAGIASRTASAYLV